MSNIEPMIYPSGHTGLHHKVFQLIEEVNMPKADIIHLINFSIFEPIRAAQNEAENFLDSVGVWDWSLGLEGQWLWLSW